MVCIIEDKESVIIQGKDLLRLVEWKLSELDDAFEEDESVDYIEFEEKTDENGEPYFLFQIYDMSISMTTVRCDKKGFNIHFGSSTPRHVKTVIQNVMYVQ
ncbi:hypothetical protein [Peribacillus sp. ACCC06369]|uniref:hypothetical protein n=1 Tax=Peribacillus sp. ACCC06369 TaxID=3055860 RepID=UPI0025A2D948|nr:hypothetical protein [Peribacillus sp. ACCC06369]MDM5359684.1 hypothetical protein [Peribacillus sp. ACCC06369]